MMPGNPGSPILVILGSSRSRGNTRMIVDAAFPETQRRLIDLGSHAFSEYDYTHANRDDAFAQLADVLVSHQCVVLATPVYWYTMSATMKRFVDRLSDLVTIRKSLGRALAGRHLYLVATSTDPTLPAGFEATFQSTAKYLDMVWGGCLHAWFERDLRITSAAAIAACHFGRCVAQGRFAGEIECC